jgi:hypothetical protein
MGILFSKQIPPQVPVPDEHVAEPRAPPARVIRQQRREPLVTAIRDDWTPLSVVASLHEMVSYAKATGESGRWHMSEDLLNMAVADEVDDAVHVEVKWTHNFGDRQLAFRRLLTYFRDSNTKVNVNIREEWPALAPGTKSKATRHLQRRVPAQMVLDRLTEDAGR